MSTTGPPLKQGFLAKRSRNAWPVARFQRRYFRLYPGELQYFYTLQETVPRRRIPLRLDTKVTPTNDQGYERCFVVKTSPTENFYVQADREDEKDEWVHAIYDALRRTEDVAGVRDEEELPPRPAQTPQVAEQVPQRIVLDLTVVGAKGLKGVNYMANAKSDPYCVITFIGKDGAVNRSEEVKTKYVTDTVDPVWKENFKLGYAVDLTSVEAIHFELLDHEVMGRPKPLGFVKVPLSTFQMSSASTRQSEVVDRSFRLHPPPERSSVMDYVTGGPSSPRHERKEKETMTKDHGELHLVMSIAGPNLVSFFRSLHHTIAPLNQVVTKSEDHSDNRLEVTVLCARDLIAADFNKSSDPFVELKLLDDKYKPIRGEYHRTTTKEKTRNPAWQDEHCVFGRVSRIEDASYLHVRVVDWDKTSKNDPLGYVTINLATLSAHSQTDWYTLLPEDKMAIRENLGSIQLKISLTGETRGERDRRLEIIKEVASKAHEVSVEQIELEYAQLQLHEAACSLDGAKIACAVNDYQAREPQFYGLNGCIHYLNTQLPRAHLESAATEEAFHSRAGIEGQALLEVTVLGTQDLKKPGTTMTSTSPYALIEIDPSVSIEECKRISAPQSPQKSKRVEASVAATEARRGMFERRAQAEVSSHRAKLSKNEMRSERHLDAPDEPMLKVEVKSGHGFIGVDFGGYSDPYCTLTLTDRVTGKPVDSEKKRTAVINKTLNPVWENEVFLMGSTFPLDKAGTLLIHVKDHNMTRSTPLGRVQIPLSDLCHASATSTSISSTAKEKRYALMPEPWMKKHAQSLGELCIKTEVIGDATVLAEMLQRSVAEGSPSKMLSFLSMQSFSSEAHLSEGVGMSSMSLSGFIGDEDETTEIIEKGKPMRTSTVTGTSVMWRKEKFELSLSYPGLFSGAGREGMHKYVLRLRVHSARNLLGVDDDMRQLQGKEQSRRNHLLGQRAKTSAYFTVIPAHRDGRLEDSQRKQSLTVYGTRNPNWPDREFVFDNLKSLQSISHLSLHVYSRDLESEVTRPIADILTKEERGRSACLERYLLRKVGVTGLVEDNGYEVLPFGQRVLAYRKCDNSGRFFPATVCHYNPAKIGYYDVLFEDDIETIDDLWDLFSLDAKGKIELIHSDGTVDVSIEDKDIPYARNVPISLLKPVDAFTDDIQSVMARCVDASEELKSSWNKLKHNLSELKLSVASVEAYPKYASQLRVEITCIGFPLDSPSQDGLGISQTGELKLTNGESIGMLTQDRGEEKLSWKLNYKCDSKAVGRQKHFEDAILVLGGTGDDPESKLIKQTASLLINVLVEDVNSGTKPSTQAVVIGCARVDLVTLANGANKLTLRLLPPKSIDYYKYVGSVSLEIKCVKSTNSGVTSSTGASDDAIVHGADAWFKRRSADLVSSPHGDKMPKWSRISLRRQLRTSLTPTENAQIDAFHTVLVIVMKRVISILREIQLFDDFEALATEDFPKFHHVHHINADPKSEWIGRPINEIPLETRKTIVESLEFELLEIAGSGVSRDKPSSGPTSREQWIKERVERQQKLRKVNGFFMQDRSSSGVLTIPCCFTGEGMVNWIKGESQKAPVLWQDAWTKYCDDESVKETCKLGWRDPDTKDIPESKIDPDALEDPKKEPQALMWLNALNDAGFIENVTPTLSITNTNRKPHLVEAKPDTFYRLREVERWAFKQTREKSLCPLDLVPEVDYWQQVDLLPDEPRPSSPPPSPKKRKDVLAPSQDRDVVVDKAEKKNDALAVRKRMYAKKLTDHVEGFLGLQNGFSGILFSQEVQDSSLLKPVAAKTQQLISQKLLWDWKYCLFVPRDKMLYVYDSEFSTLPSIILDVNNSACRAAYNFTYEAAGGWFNVVGATVMHASIANDGSSKYVPIDDTLRDKLMKVTKDGTLAFEFKTSNAQVWVQSFLQAHIRVDMKPNQPVVLKRLNPAVLQTKCTDQVANYNPNDLEGSFQGMLNKFFKHCGELSQTDTENKMRLLRARVRNELKKPGVLGETIMAYFGSTRKFNPGPTNERAFASQGDLKSGRIVRIRAPFVDAKDSMQTYEIKDAPKEMQDVLEKYGVHDRTSWLKVPKQTRDVFLLYDVEYEHDHEIIREEDLLRVHIRTNGGDLDSLKVKERCTDLNIWFKPSDLEDCVTRIVLHTGVRKPLGCLKIPLKTVSAHRIMDMWYPLGPEHDMVQKAKLGQIRVQLRLVPVNEVLRSKKVSEHLLEEVKDAAATAAAAKPLAVAIAAAASPFKRNKSSKQTAGSPTTGGASILSQEPSFIKIRVLEGRKLICADIDTKTSDPYVEILLIRESDGKEEHTKMKTDIKYKTLSPKWSNQEFVLGKSPDTVLSDKKAILLRVRDHDYGMRDDKMGCIKIELVRNKSRHISGLELVYADEKGSTLRRGLDLSDKMQVVVDEKLLPDSGMSKTVAKANDPVADGKLGKLRFVIELHHNDNFVDPSGVAASQMATLMRSLETKYSCEVQFSSNIPVSDELKECSCVFTPRGEGNQRISYDLHTEDLGKENKLKLGDLLASTSNGPKPVKILGRTFDMTKVEWFDIELHHPTSGKVFTGRYPAGSGDKLNRRDPRKQDVWVDEDLKLFDKEDKKRELTLGIRVRVVALHRAKRLKRLLAETFRMVGLEFDTRRINEGTERRSGATVEDFLWGVCKAHFLPGRNMTEELMAQVHRMRQSSRLHWKFTPHLLGMVFEHVFQFGSRDRLSFEDAVALDDILSRWSIVLEHLSEAKSQLVGHLHGQETPRLVRDLMMECDWTGFELASLPSRASTSTTSGSTSTIDRESDAFEETVLEEGTKVQVLLPARKHAGIPVDFKHSTGQYYAGTIVTQYGDDKFEVLVCAYARTNKEGSDGVLSDEELPPLEAGEGVRVCQRAKTSSLKEESDSAGQSGEVLGGPDTKGYYKIELHNEESTTVSISRTYLDYKEVKHGDTLLPQLVKDDFVRVYSTADPNRMEGGTLARVVKNHCNGKYDIQYLEMTRSKNTVANDDKNISNQQTGQDYSHTEFVIEENVPRARLEKEKHDKEIYEAKVLRSYISPVSISDSADEMFAILYDLQLENGDFIRGVARNVLRPHHETFPSDKCVLASIFVKEFALQDEAEIQSQVEAEKKAQVSRWLNELYAHDQLVKVYVMAPAQPQEITLRDLCTTKRLEEKLNPRDPKKPRFVEQCHGYSTTFSDEERAKLNEIFRASLAIRENVEDLDESKQLDIKRCFCLFMAPRPRIEVHGTLRVTAENSESSQSLFNLLKDCAIKDKNDQDNRVLALFQMLIRNCTSEGMPLKRKGRVVFAKEVKIVSEKELDIVFEISIAPNNLGSLAHEVGVAHGDGNMILERLKKLEVLIGQGDQPTSIADVRWTLGGVADTPPLKPNDVEGTPSLKVTVHDKDGKTDKPSLSLEMLPLDDQRLSVLDVEGNVWELCIPMDQVLVGAQLRRHLVPYHQAKVVKMPSMSDSTKPQEISVQLNQRSRRDSLLRNKPTEPLKVKRRSTGRRLTVKFGDREADIPEHDIKYDILNIVVTQASELTLDEGVGKNKLEMQVSLVSRDFCPDSESDLSLKTPYGEVLSETGEIVKGVRKQPLPSFEQILEKDGSTAWKAPENSKPLVFGLPCIDLEHVSHVRIRIRTHDKKVLVGMSDIPISDIALTTSSDSKADEVFANDARSSLLQKFVGVKKKDTHRPRQSKLSSLRTFPLSKKENGQDNTVGKITLFIDRIQCAAENDSVLAKRFEKDEDSWQISAYELLTLTLKQHEDHMMRGLLATSPPLLDGTKPEALEQLLQKIANVMMISHAMELIYATKPEGEKKSLSLRDGSAPHSSFKITDHMKQAITHTKWFIEDTAEELGIRTKRKRLPWSAEVIEDERQTRKRDFVVMKANISNASMRVRRTMLKLNKMYRDLLIPTIQDLYEADAMGDNIDVQRGEALLRLFDREVEDLVEADRKIYVRVNRRVRLIKIAKVLQDIMHATLIVTVMNYDHAMGDDEIGTAYIPLIDLLDGLEHNNGYELTKKKRRSGQPASPRSTVTYSSSSSQGKVHLKIKLSYSDSSLLEQATRIFKVIKEKYVAQHELARQRINAAVVPAQRRRWLTIKGHLDELKVQSTSKLHWQRTPILLSLVWDIFITHDQAIQKVVDEEEKTHLEGLVEKANEYRSAVVVVHNRWANLQPLLEELLQVQAAEKIHAKRTPELLDLIDREVEGMDLVLTTAYEQVSNKWLDLKNALEELVRMQQRKKINLRVAPQLLSKVTNRCSKGLNERYAEAVSEVQFRWMAITKSDGPLNELRLTEKKGLHWRRTHELILLLNEQCEGFAEVDAETLNIVNKRWEQVQEWLEGVVQMQVQHRIDCEETPFILKKMHLIETKQKARKKKHAIFAMKKKQDRPVSPRGRSPTRSSRRESDPPSPRATSPSVGVLGQGEEVDVEVDVDRLEGLAEWYAIEESKRELERIPYHRITTDYDRNSRLRYSQDGKDTRLFITQEEMAFTPRNVRAALVDRGVIPLMASVDGTTDTATAIDSPTKTGATMTVPKDIMAEIKHLEESVESMYSTSGSPSALYVKWNPERVAELYLIIESLGKSDLLWKIDHAVSLNDEIEVPSDVNKLLMEMRLRSIQTTEIDELIRTLLTTLQKEELVARGITVPSTANYTTVLKLMHRHQVKDIVLPSDIREIQLRLQDKAMDKMGEPVFLRGMRIGTQMWNPDDGPSDSSAHGKAGTAKINVGLGIVDSKIEQLRKMLLIEALRKRNSLIKTFPVESHVLTDEELAECTEVEMSGDYMTLIERFQQLLIHESYTKRLAEYAAMDRCMRALLNVGPDTIVTKEDIAQRLQAIKNSRFRLPLEAFTREELDEAARKGTIRTPTEDMLARCPVGRNAKAMAYYAAMSYAALVFQETVHFPARFNPVDNSFVDAFPFTRASTADGMSIPKNRSRMSLKEYVVDWLMGTEESVVKIQRRLGEYHRRRLEWASAAFTLRNRWYQRGFGWCDDATRCAGVKVLLQKLLLFEAANKMHMTDTAALLSEINDKCTNLRERERYAKEQLDRRYSDNLIRLEKLVDHAEKCINNRKIHAEDAPALLHTIEQACVVPYGLDNLHRQAYHVVSTHWARHRVRLSELVHMQKQGTFDIKRTPELLSAMEFHTEGIAGADELTIEKVMETVSASSTPVEVQQRYLDKKEDEIRRGQRKQSSSLRLNLDDANTEKDTVLEDLKEHDGDNNYQWESLSPSKRDVRPLSPREKQTSWKVVSGDEKSPAKPTIVIEDKFRTLEQRRKSSIGDELRELLKSPSKWLIGTSESQSAIRPEVFFPREVTIDNPHSTSAAEPTQPIPPPAPATATQ